MASLSIPIQTGTDDAGHYPGFWSNNATQHELGWDPVFWSDEFHGFWRWPVTFSIPKPLIITAAHIEARATEGPGVGGPPPPPPPTIDPGEMWIRFFNEDANPTARDFTTDLYPTWIPNALRISWIPGVAYSSGDWLATSDIKQYVQAWVDRPGFANGQYFAVRMDPPDTSGVGIVMVKSYENTPTEEPPVLKIWYAAVVPPVVAGAQPAAEVRVPRYPVSIKPPTETVEEFAAIPDEFITGAR